MNYFGLSTSILECGTFRRQLTHCGAVKHIRSPKAEENGLDRMDILKLAHANIPELNVFSIQQYTEPTTLNRFTRFMCK